MNFTGNVKTVGSPQSESTNNTKISLTNSSTRLNDDSDGETRSTMGVGLKLMILILTLFYLRPLPILESWAVYQR